jgi:hypothetical protein
MQITQPVTMLTDYAMAAASLAFAASVARTIGPGNRVSAWFWSAAFTAAAVAGALGGTYHGFATQLDTATLRAMWNLVMFAMGACAAFITAGIHSAYIRRKEGTVKWLAYGILVTLAGAAVQQTQFRHTANFNHNDAYHLIQIVGLYFLFRCAQTVKDRPGAGPTLGLEGPSALDRSSRRRERPQIRRTET